MGDRDGESDEGTLSIIDVDVARDEYGIEGDFVPVAVFEGDQNAAKLNEQLGEEVHEETEEDEEKMEEEGEEEKVSEAEGEEMKSEVEEEGTPKPTEGEGEEKETTEEKKAVPAKEEEQEEKKDIRFEAEEGPVHKKKKDAYKRRMSVRKKSIYYQAVSRLRTTEDQRVSGDFTTIQEDLLGNVGTPPSILSFEPDSGEFSFEEEIVEEEEAPPVDREHYYNLHKKLTPERVLQRMKNNFLHRKMAEYFRKRKMEHVLKETDQQVDSQQRYDRKLDALSDLRDLDTRERNSITSELNDMRNQRNDQLSMLNIHFNAMQNREKEIGTGLINTKTGKEIPDKLIERLLKRQKDKLTEVATMRLFYIKIRDRVGEKKAALHALDCIGDNLHLIDYEQLKIENQSHTDKIEERDEELGRLRVKCHGAMQCLAHIREKCAAMQIDIQSLNERYEEVDIEYAECRERLNYFKLERDNYRIETDRLYEESGLLGKPKLLLNMEDAMKEVELKSQQLENLKEENRKLKYSIKTIKKNIETAPTKIHILKEFRTFKPAGNRIYRGRPTLVYPQLPRSSLSGSAN